MSREIKFRAWDITEDKMIHDFGLSPEDYHAYIIPEGAEYSDQFEYYDNIELMQYTGLKDKNGVEIYEGDIIARIASDNLGRFLGQVKYEHARYVIISNGYEKFKNGRKVLQFNRSYPMFYEVIGNIYENPELLK